MNFEAFWDGHDLNLPQPGTVPTEVVNPKTDEEIAENAKRVADLNEKRNRLIRGLVQEHKGYLTITVEEEKQPDGNTKLSQKVNVDPEKRLHPKMREGLEGFVNHLLAKFEEDPDKVTYYRTGNPMEILRELAEREEEAQDQLQHEAQDAANQASQKAS